MIKVLKYLTACFVVMTITMGVYFYFSFTNIYFVIKNESDEPITTHITLHSKAKNKDYTYPLLGNVPIRKGSSIESFYTVDQASDGTICAAVEFRDVKGKVIKTLPCPKEGETLVLNRFHDLP